MGIEIASGRFGSPSISATDIDTIKQAGDRNHIGNVFTRAWDAVADWFSGTNREEAKKCLFDLYSNTATDAQKIESFEKLKNCAGENYKNRFQTADFDGYKTYTLHLDTDGVENFSLTRKNLEVDSQYIEQQLMADRTSENLQNQLTIDIGRGHYSIAGKALTEESPEKKLENFNQSLDALGCTALQKKAIMEICNQSIFGIAMSAATKPDSQGERAITLVCPAAQNVSYDISCDNGEFRVKAQCYKDTAINFNADRYAETSELIQEIPDAYKSMDIQLSLNIKPSGEITAEGLNFYVNKSV